MNQKPPTGVWPIPLTDDCFFVDNSTQERMQTCLRSAGYYVSHKRELNRPKPAQQFGKIIHKALELRYKSPSPHVTDALQSEMVQVVTNEFEKYTPPEDDFRNYGVAVSAIRQYAAQYMLEAGETYILPDGRPFVEIPFAQPLGELNVDAMLWVRNPDGTIVERYVKTITVVQKGKIDRVYRRDGRIYGQDHKTTSVMGAQYFAEFELSSQVHCYSWAIRRLLGELPAGYVINGLGIRKPTKTGKALEFIQQTIPVWPALVTEWEQDTMQLVGVFIEGARTNQLPKMTKWCVGKYGLCEYKQVCGMEPHLREVSLYSNEYADVTWDPLHE